MARITHWRLAWVGLSVVMDGSVRERRTRGKEHRRSKSTFVL